MMLKIPKLGKYHKIDQQGDFRLYEIKYNGEENILYKVYYKNDCISHWKSHVDLHLMQENEELIEDTDTYQKYLDVIDDMESMLLYQDDEDDDYDEVEDVTPHYAYETKSDFADWSRKYNYNTSYTPKETTGLADGLKKSNTLVIHCADNSTDMLSQIYDGKGWDVLTDGSIAEDELHDLLACHDRIVMLGHGTGGGLINVQYGKGGKRGTVIDSRYVEDLKNKKLFVIWCNADRFFLNNDLGHGQFITKNVPSEVWEARAVGYNVTAQWMLENITYWSKCCADVIELALGGNPQEAVRIAREKYQEKYGNKGTPDENGVTDYNTDAIQVLP